MQAVCQPLPAPSATSASATALIPAWHTRLLIALLLLVPSTALWWAPRGALPTSPLLSSYAPLVLVNVGLSLYVTRLGLRRSALRELLGKAWPNVRRAASDCLWAALLASAILAVETSVRQSGIAAESLAAHALVARSALEKICWPVVALVVGGAEELVYRGYLQQRLAKLSGQVWFGVVAQALLFGIAHGEQGGATVLRFAIYALGFGSLAHFRSSLMPGLLCHVGLDAYAGLWA